MIINKVHNVNVLFRGFREVFSAHSVIEFFQADDREELLHVDSVVFQQLHKFHLVLNQGFHHDILQNILLGKQMRANCVE